MGLEALTLIMSITILIIIICVGLEYIELNESTKKSVIGLELIIAVLSLYQGMIFSGIIWTYNAYSVYKRW